MITLTDSNGKWVNQLSNKVVSGVKAEPKEGNTLDVWSAGNDVNITSEIREKELTLNLPTAQGGRTYTATANFDKDIWADASVSTSDNIYADSNSIGDGVPDKYQVLVNYASGDGGAIAAGANSFEVITIKNGNDFATSGTVMADGSAAEADTEYVFEKWVTSDSKVQIDNYKSETIGNMVIAHTSGYSIYTVTANFAEDKFGNDGSDGIADKYQVKLEFAIENGKWLGKTVGNKWVDAEENTDVHSVWVTLYDINGIPATDGTGLLSADQLPVSDIDLTKSDMKADKSFDQNLGKWSLPGLSIHTDITDAARYIFTFDPDIDEIKYLEEQPSSVDYEPAVENTVSIRDSSYITVDPNGGNWTYNGNGQRINNSADIATFEVTDEVTDLGSPVRDGYLFLGWTCTAVPSGNSRSTEPVYKFTAGWTVDIWSDAEVTFAADDIDSKTGGDGIPDYKQALIEFVAGTHGSIEDGSTGGKAVQVYTLNSDGAKNYSKKVTPVEVKATPEPGYVFGFWTKDADEEKSVKPFEETALTGGQSILYKAHFRVPASPAKPETDQASRIPDMLNGSDHFAYVIGYDDNTVKPQANITRAEVATIFFRLLDGEIRDANLTSSNSFADVNEGEWYNTAISTMAKLGIVNGRDSSTFDPNAKITRAEFAAICARFAELKTPETKVITDIAGHWAENLIESAVAHGWVTGYEDNTFRPQNYITRAEAMTLINRVLCRVPETASDLLGDMTVFVDNSSSAWYYLAVQEATNSHNFEYKDNVYEKWTSLKNNPDWSRYA